MKLATLKDGSRDGLLAVVSRDLASAHFATGITTRLQHVLDDWNFLSPQLEDLSAALNAGRARHAFAFDPGQCMAALPRAFARVEGAACPGHARRVFGVAMSDGRLPLALRPCDALQGPLDEARFALLRSRDPSPRPADAALEGAAGEPGAPGGAGAPSGEVDGPEGEPAPAGADFAATLLALTGDIPARCGNAAALEGVRLLTMGVDFWWRTPGGEAIGAWHECAGLAGTALAPVALTPDELGAAWRGGRAQLELLCRLNGRTMARFAIGPAMKHHFGQLIAEAAARRPLQAGTLVGCGALSSEEPEQGCASLAERRAVEAVAAGAPATPWLHEGDTVRIEALDAQGQAPFGAIEARVAFAGRARAPAGVAA